MKIINLTDRPLTQEETSEIEHHAYYVDGKLSLIYIGNGTTVTVSDSEPLDTNEAIEVAKASMRAALSSHPDFEAILMDDFYGVIMMENELTAISSRPLTEEEKKENKLPYSLAIDTRNRCLDACTASTVIAYAIPDQA